VVGVRRCRQLERSLLATHFLRTTLKRCARIALGERRYAELASARSRRFQRRLLTQWTMSHSPLSPELKREISRAMDRLNRMNLPDWGTVDLMDYTISFCGRASFLYMFEEIFAKASYLFHSDTDRPLIFDCGSNIGMSVLFFKKKLYPAARITAFEPDPRTFSVLNENIRDNGLTDVPAHQVALGSRDGFVDFYRDENESSSSLLMSVNRERLAGSRWRPVLRARHIQVQARRLSTFIESDIDLLKIDVEGAELEVMQDLVAAGKLRRARRIHLEYHHHIGAAPDNFSAMLRLLESAGFGYQIRSDYGGQWPWPTENAFQDVALYCYRRGER
jgi:FkbM family methyltransferase